MNYQETLDYLYQQLPMFSRIGASAIKKDLTNTLAICQALGDPHKKIKTVHIAGTNGKGSVSHMLSAIFQTAGYKTGLYTSPHLKDFRERIKLNGQMCSKEFVTDFVAKNRQLIAEIQPSFFEITVAMAFQYFAEQQVDIAIIETGLGGRLDSTNVILSELSIITNIGWDHMDILGNTLPLIAGEKAGIIKHKTPIVIGEFLPETRPVFATKAEKEEAPIFWAQENWKIIQTTFGNNFLNLQVQHLADQAAYNFQLDLMGLYQQENLITVLESVHQLQRKGWNITSATVQKAVSQVKSLTGMRGRWDILQQRPYLIMDVGHNKSCMEEIVRSLSSMSYHSLYIICGFVKDKDIHAALQVLPAKAQYLYTQAHIPRALPVEQLVEIGKESNRNGEGFANVNEAIAVAKQKADAEDLILICGSFFVLSEIEGLY